MKRTDYTTNVGGFGTAAIIGIVAVLAIGGVLIFTGNKTQNEQPATTSHNGDMMDDKDMMEKKEMMDDAEMSDDMDGEKKMEAAMDDTMMKKPDAQETVAGSYEAYAPEKVAMAENGDVVLFFHATWCPSCRTLDSAMKENAASIPDNTHILMVDYDKNIDLRKKYGVTKQHTMVQVDKDGNKVAMWSGGSTLDAVLGKIQ